jgi:hypothetical protein
LRNLIDESVWQPERLSFDAGADCGTGLMQKRPETVHAAGRALTLVDVALTDQELEQIEALKDAARGVPPTDPDKPGTKSVRHTRTAKTQTATTPSNVAPQSTAKAARIMQALLHVPPDIEYPTWIQIGMGLKTSCGEAGFAIWKNWSKTAACYEGEQALRAKWLSFDGRAVTLGTVYHHAKLYGWSPKKPRIALPLPVRDLPIERHEPLADTVGIHEARSVTLKKLYAEIVKNDTPAPLAALRITVGVGKTSNLKTLFEDAKRAKRHLLIVARDRTQCQSYEEAGAFWRHGRENTEEGFSPQTPWHCPHVGTDGPVSRLAEAEHRLAQMCRGGHCEHGNKAMLDQAAATGREPSDVVIRFFKEFPEKRSTKACMWFDHMGDSQRQKNRVVTAAGLSPADLKTENGGQVDQIIIDESVEWSHSHALDLTTIRGYIESLQSLQDKFTVDQCKTENGFGARVEVPAWLAKTPEIFRDLAIQMGRHAATAKPGAYSPVEFDLPNIVNALGNALDDHGAAVWEKPEWQRWTDLVKAPLRALSAIRDGIDAGSLTMIDGALHVTYLHSVIENAMKKSIPILVMDATLDATAQALIPQEQVTHIVAEPNCDWIIEPRWFMSAKKDKESLTKESSKLRKTWQSQETATGFQSYVICRRTLALFILAQKTGMTENKLLEMPTNALWDLSVEQRIGWYGWHDTAHDEWNGLNCLLWGQHPVPDHTRMQQWMDHRALLMQTMPGEAPLPISNNEWTAGQWVGTGADEQQSMARLPVQPEIRAWLLQKVSDQKIQAAGRTRAVCQDRRVSVWQIGGYPMLGLAEHGIRPVYDRLVAGLSGAEVAAIHEHQRIGLINESAAMIVAAGDTITREKIRLICNSLIANESSGKFSVRSRYMYINQGRTLNGALDVNKNNELDKSLFTDGGLWDAEYAKWRTAATSEKFRAHLARGDDVVEPAAARSSEDVITEKATTVMNVHELLKKDPDSTPQEQAEALQMVDALVNMNPDPDHLVEIAWGTIDFGGSSPVELIAARLILERFEKRIEDVPFFDQPTPLRRAS